jgi:hypothetical protein
VLLLPQLLQLLQLRQHTCALHNSSNSSSSRLLVKLLLRCTWCSPTSRSPSCGEMAHQLRYRQQLVLLLVLPQVPALLLLVTPGSSVSRQAPG